MSRDIVEKPKYIELEKDSNSNLLTTKITHGEAYNLIKQYRNDQDIIEDYENKVLKILNSSVVLSMVYFTYLVIMICILFYTKRLIVVLAILVSIVAMLIILKASKFPNNLIDKETVKLKGKAKAKLEVKSNTTISNTRLYEIDNLRFVIVDLFVTRHKFVEIQTLGGEHILVELDNRLIEQLRSVEDTENALILLTKDEYDYLIN